MEKLDVLYDHYKETFLLSSEAQKKRSVLFVSLAISITILFLFLIDSDGVIEIISDYLNNNFSVILSIRTAIIQTFVWVIVLYLFIRYFQTNIYIERQYSYIEQLEQDISKELKNIFNRESQNYLKKYPKVLNTIDFIYKWAFPVLAILLIALKIISEWFQKNNIISCVIDSIIAIAIILLSVLYLIFLHPRKEKE
jgi:H+/gluconate symporter-like permease